jgi:hypothetical protein
MQNPSKQIFSYPHSAAGFGSKKTLTVESARLAREGELCVLQKLASAAHV